MKVGLFVTNQQPLDADMVSALGDQIAMVHVARDRGWNSLLSGQHYLNEGNNKQLQTVPFLARLAAEAGEMTIGLGILLLNLHNPVYTAETVATLDIITRGNFIFGVGLGYRDVEFDAFGVPKGERVKRFEEYLALVQRLWTEDSVSYEGPGCRLDEVRMNIRPVQKPRPPIWMAANNDPAVKRAARLADAWFINPHATIDTIRRQMAVYRAELKAAGKDSPRELPVIKEVYCAKDRATALAMAGPYLLAKYRDYAKWGQDKVMPDNTDFNRSLEELIEGRFILGSPEQCYDQLEPYWQEFGVNHIVIRTHWAGMPLSTALASMRLISDELLPALQKV
jgi:alkanesulfonate monooxygenase SsuD/methylene tetrahydromethanopterin reductase-like flavin-dependent oxidoreductase (luciferase family)